MGVDGGGGAVESKDIMSLLHRAGAQGGGGLWLRLRALLVDVFRAEQAQGVAADTLIVQSLLLPCVLHVLQVTLMPSARWAQQQPSCSSGCSPHGPLSVLLSCMQWQWTGTSMWSACCWLPSSG